MVITVRGIEEFKGLAAAEDEAELESNGEPAAEDAKSEEGSGVWKWLKRGKGGPVKKEPGKLPPRSEGATKDSRSAAADILREMQRRR